MHAMTRPTKSPASASDSAARPLLRAFHGQRPIRAGSLLITIFGDSVAPRGGEIALGSLIELARPLGLSERLVRTSIGRLAQEDWLEATRAGRLSYYRLTARGRHEFAAATRRIYGAVASEWPGVWTLVLMPALSAAQRETIARELRWRGFGRPMPGVLAYPDDRLEEVREELAAHGLGAQALALTSTMASREEDARLVSRSWDLTELERRYRRFVRLFEPVAGSVERALPAPTHCFVIRTLLIHEYRRIHLRDPLLPPSLLPPSWTGTTAAELTRTLYGRVFRGTEQFISEHAANRAGPLPPASTEALRRFGPPDG